MISESFRCALTDQVQIRSSVCSTKAAPRLYVPDPFSVFSHKKRCLGSEALRNFLVASLQRDWNHRQIFKLLYQTILNGLRRVNLIRLSAVKTGLEKRFQERLDGEGCLSARPPKVDKQGWNWRSR
jgi:hypothetical protein